MKYHPYIAGNFLLIDIYDEVDEEWTVTAQCEGLAKDVLPRFATNTSTTVYFNGVNGAPAEGIALADMVDGSDFETELFADRTAFNTWYQSNLGKSSAGDSALPKEIHLAVGQNGTSAPSVTVTHNGTGAVLVPEYLETGVFTITSDREIFTPGKIVPRANRFSAHVIRDAGGLPQIYQFIIQSTTVIKVETYDATGIPADDVMTGQTISIIIYP